MAQVQPFRVTPLTPESGGRFVLGVGAVFYDVDTSTISADMEYEALVSLIRSWRKDGKGFGATTGDGNFILNHNIEDIDTNDRISRVIGLLRMGEITAALTASIQEITFENLQRLVPTSFIDETGALRSRNQLLASHFKTIVWVGTRNDGALWVIELTNALQINEINMTQTGGATGASIPVNFVGTAATLDDMQFGPYKIWYVPIPASNSNGGNDGGTTPTDPPVDPPVDPLATIVTPAAASAAKGSSRYGNKNGEVTE